MFVCTKGNITILTKDEKVVLAAGDIAVIPPNFPHTKLGGNDDRECEWCGISFLCIKRQVKNSVKLYASFENFASNSKIVLIRDKLHFCNEITDIVRNSQKYNSVLPALKVVAAIGSLIHEYGNMACELHNDLCGQTSNADIGLLYKLNHIINSCFMIELTNAQIAERLFISERQLSRITAKHYGTSIRHLIIDRRLVSAEKLLHDTSNTVESIGKSVGYNSKSGFYRDFRKKYGVTPVQYRKISSVTDDKQI